MSFYEIIHSVDLMDFVHSAHGKSTPSVSQKVEASQWIFGNPKKLIYIFYQTFLNYHQKLTLGP
jgi:hypothetical protein